MKTFLWTLAGICAAAAGLILWGPKQEESTRKLPYLLGRIGPIDAYDVDEFDLPSIAG